MLGLDFHSKSSISIIIMILNLRHIFLFSSLLFWLALCTAQNSFFNGGIDIGTGISTIIDTSKINNGYAMPLHLGVITNREIDKQTYLELELLITKQGNKYMSYYRDGGGIERRVLSLIYFDFRTSWNRLISLPLNCDPFLCIGISNSMLIVNPSNFSGSRFVDEHFRNYNFSVFSGLRIQKKNIRWSLLYNFSPLSVVRREFASDLTEFNPDYGGRIYLTDLSLHFTYIFK